VAFPLWCLGSNPSKKIICVSYADELARKLAVDSRTVLESPWLRDLYPRLRLASKRPRTMDLPTTEHGSRYAAGMNGAVLGRGADLIVIDDPIKATDALSKAERRRVNDAFDNTIYTRLNSKREGAIIIIMQRLHQDDLVGHVLAKGDWEVVSIPAIEIADREYRLSDEPEDVYFRRAGEVLHNDREGREELEIVRRTQGSLLFSAQYQQAPVPPEGNIVKRDWIRFYDAPPPSFDFTIASWDTASTISDTADYSVGTTWGAKGLDFYLLDVVRDRFEVPELRQRILELARRRSVDQSVIEDTDIGRAIAQDLRRAGEHRAILRRPRFDKEARILAQSARFEAGQVHVPRDAPWLAALLDELLAFPNGQHDDQVDSTSQALDYLSARTLLSHAAQQPRERPPGRARPAGCRRPE